jgi:hypothetical protein
MTCLVFRFSSVIFLTFPGDFLDTNPSSWSVQLIVFHQPNQSYP